MEFGIMALMADFIDWDYHRYQKNIHWGFFWVHAALCLATNVGFLAINLSGSIQYIWFIYPAIVWGLILYFHFRMVQFILSGKWQAFWEKLLNRF